VCVCPGVGAVAVPERDPGQPDSRFETQTVGGTCEAVEDSHGQRQGTPMDHSLYLADIGTITTDRVRQFLTDLIDEQLLTENLTVELKAKRDKYNVAEAVCALANTEGGLILLGVDERDVPAMAGVPPEERDAIVRQLTATLEPAFMPEITTVTADDPGRAVIVLRVNPDDVPEPPMLCRGRAFIRQPGQTSRATLDQLLGLVRRASAGHQNHMPAGASATSMFFPRSKTGSPDDVTIPDICMRAAGGMALVGRPAETLNVGTSLRRRLETLVNDSQLATWAGGHLPHDRQVRWEPIAAKHFLWEARRRVPRRFAPEVSLRLHVHAEGRRFAFFVDVEIRFGAQEEVRSALLSVHDLSDGVLRLVDLVDRAMLDTISTELKTPPRAHESTTVWITAADQDLHRLVHLDQFIHDVDQQRVSVSQFEINRFDERSLRAVLQAWLTTLLLDDGVRDAEQHAHDIISGLPAEVDAKPWL